MSDPVGIDVASYQAGASFPNIARAGFKFVYVKASQGRVTTPYPTTAKHWDGAGASGLVRGLYHYAEPLFSPESNADAFSRWVSAFDAASPGCLPPCLDLETAVAGNARDWATRFFRKLRSNLGKPELRVMLYTYYSFYNESLAGDWVDDNTLLWMARYGSNDVRLSPKVVIHQYSNAGLIPNSPGTYDFDRALVPLEQIVIPSAVSWANFPNLSYGQSSAFVKGLQTFLIDNFPAYNEYQATGYYGDATTAGVAEFQRRTGITGPDANGRTVGPRTNRELSKYGYAPV